MTTSPSNMASGTTVVPLKWATARFPSAASTELGSYLSLGDSSEDEEECQCSACTIQQEWQPPADSSSAAPQPPQVDRSRSSSSATGSELSDRRRKMVDARTFATFPQLRSRSACGGLFTTAALRLRTGQWVERDDQTDSMTVWALGVTAMLFASITLLQTWGALLAHSNALLVDCISMGVDSASYFGSIAVHSQLGTRLHAPLELLVAGASLGALLSFTTVAVAESWHRVLSSSMQEEAVRRKAAADSGDQMNPHIVLFFGALGILFDVASLCAFWRGSKSSTSTKQMSVWTAMMHVGADLLRSGTTVAMSVAVLAFDVDSATADVWASLAVGGVILVGAGLGVVEWLKHLEQWASGHSAPFEMLGADGSVALHQQSSDDEEGVSEMSGV